MDTYLQASETPSRTSDDIREGLRSLDHVEQARFLQDEFSTLYRFQSRLTSLAMSEPDAAEQLLSQQAILSQHARLLTSMSQNNLSTMAYCVPKPVAVAVDLQMSDDASDGISLVGSGGERIPISQVLGGVEHLIEDEL